MRYYTLAEAAKLHGLHRYTIRRWGLQGLLRMERRQCPIPGQLGPKRCLCIDKQGLSSIPRLVKIREAEIGKAIGHQMVEATDA